MFTRVLAGSALLLTFQLHAQTSLVERCRALTERVDAGNQKQLAEIDAYQRQVTANKDKAREVAAEAQAAYEARLTALFLNTPDIASYVADWRMLTPNQRQSGLGAMLKSELYRSSAIEHMKAEVKKLAGGSMIQVNDQELGNVQVSDMHDLNGLKMRTGATGYLKILPDGAATLMVSTSAWAHEAPRYGTMSNGMKMVDLATGQEIEYIAGLPNWGGLTQRVVLDEPFSKWEREVSAMQIDEDSEEVRACRGLK